MGDIHPLAAPSFHAFLGVLEMRKMDIMHAPLCHCDVVSHILRGSENARYKVVETLSATINANHWEILDARFGQCCDG